MAGRAALGAGSRQDRANLHTVCSHVDQVPCGGVSDRLGSACGAGHSVR
jgi:hypothetical protein